MTRRKALTFREIYNEVKKKPTPTQEFFREVAEVAHKSQISVRRWIWSDTEPDELTKQALADHFGTTIENLFPPKK